MLCVFVCPLLLGLLHLTLVPGVDWKPKSIIDGEIFEILILWEWVMILTGRGEVKVKFDYREGQISRYDHDHEIIDIIFVIKSPNRDNTAWSL